MAAGKLWHIREYHEGFLDIIKRYAYDRTHDNKCIPEI